MQSDFNFQADELGFRTDWEQEVIILSKRSKSYGLDHFTTSFLKKADSARQLGTLLGM